MTDDIADQNKLTELEEQMSNDPEIQRRRSIVQMLGTLSPGHWHIVVTEDGEWTSVEMRPRMKMGKYIMSGVLDADGTFIARAPVAEYDLMWADIGAR